MDPFLKWAGGKRWLRRFIRDANLPPFKRYIEPFLGSGAIFFDIAPSSAILSDKNAWLIETYVALRDSPDEVMIQLSAHENLHGDEHYYNVRAKRYDSPTERAAQFIYLNRTCWNGLYRVNKSGAFNVPRGTKNSIIMPGEDFRKISSTLSVADIRCEDFENTINRSGEGDLVYCDPPYTIHHNMNGFLKYNEDIFSWDDQLRLKRALERAVCRGAVAMVSNACHDSILDLYDDFGEITRLDRASVISGKADGRGRYAEVLVRVGW